MDEFWSACIALDQIIVSKKVAPPIAGVDYSSRLSTRFENVVKSRSSNSKVFYVGIFISWLQRPQYVDVIPIAAHCVNLDEKSQQPHETA